MAKKKNKIGWWAFLIGIVGAILIGILGYYGVFEVTAMMTTILLIAGVVIGLMNIKSSEENTIMIAALVIALLSTALSLLPAVGGVLDAVFESLALVVSPIALVTALKVIWQKAQ